LISYDSDQQTYQTLDLEGVRQNGKVYFRIKGVISLGSRRIHEAIVSYNEKTNCIEAAKDFVNAFIDTADDKVKVWRGIEMMKRRIEQSLLIAKENEAECDILEDIFARLETFIVERRLKPEEEPLL
jgi:hypothetical protein